MPEQEKKITVRSKGPYLLRGESRWCVSRRSCPSTVSRFLEKKTDQSAPEKRIGYAGADSPDPNHSATTATRLSSSTVRRRSAQDRSPITARCSGPPRYSSKKTMWVTGGVPVERSDVQPLETRNRVTLCGCGSSAIKPLCDGTYKEIGFSDA